MKHNKYIFLLGLIPALLFQGCEAFIETDLKEEIVVLRSPPDGLTTTISTQTFWWNYVDGADRYSLQIVSPSFSYTERLILDTLIEQNKYSFSLIPGTYEWGVSAMNYSSQTLYSVHRLVIDSTNDISQETIFLVEPATNDTTNDTTIRFKWMPLYNAEDYNFQLFFNGNMFVSYNWLFDTITQVLDQGDGSYEWKVRGQNAFSNTAYSLRLLYLDTTPPNKPILLQPVNESVLADTIISFGWDRGLETGSSIKDSIYIYVDQFPGSILVAKLVNQPAYSDSLGPGEYYWRVRSLDAAGNKSNYSDIGHFFVIP